MRDKAPPNKRNISLILKTNNEGEKQCLCNRVDNPGRRSGCPEDEARRDSIRRGRVRSRRDTGLDRGRLSAVIFPDEKFVSILIQVHYSLNCKTI